MKDLKIKKAKLPDGDFLLNDEFVKSTFGVAKNDYTGELKFQFSDKYIFIVFEPKSAVPPASAWQSR